MKKYIFSIILITLCCDSILAQEIGLKSLEFLNQKFHLNLNKVNEPILIIVDDLEFLCLEFTDKNNLTSASQVKIKFILNSRVDNSYGFILTGSSVYKGTFEVIIVEDNFEFLNLRYIKRDD